MEVRLLPCAMRHPVEEVPGDPPTSFSLLQEPEKFDVHLQRVAVVVSSQRPTTVAFTDFQRFYPMDSIFCMSRGVAGNHRS